MLLVACPWVAAEQTLIGPTGGAFLPTADNLGSGVQVAADYYDTDGDATIPLRLTWGNKNVELGGMWASNDSSDIWGLNAKYSFPVMGLSGFAAGALYLDARDIDLNAWQGYLVYTHPFSKCDAETQFRGTLGVNWTSVDDRFDDGLDDGCLSISGDDDAFRVFGGIDVRIKERWLVGAEVQSSSGDLGDSNPLSSIYARYRVDDRWGLQAGLSNASPFGVIASDDHNFFVGVNYGFGDTCLTSPLRY